MPTVRYTAGGGRYRVAGKNFEPGDTGDVSETVADRLVEQVGDFEYVDEDGAADGAADETEPDDVDAGDEADEDADAETKDSVVSAPGEFTIDEIEAELETGEYDDHLESLRENEEDGKDRAGVYDAIGVRRAEIED